MNSSTTTLSTLGRAAVRYVEHGIAVYRQQERGKVPLELHGFQDASSSVTLTMQRWSASPSANIATVPGLCDSIVVDVDGREARDAAARLGILPGVTLTCTRGDPDRAHYWFLKPAITETIGNVKIVPEVPSLELRCDKGGITLPPSVHPSGATYRWVGQWSDRQPLPAPALEALHRARARMRETEAERLAPRIDPSMMTPETIDRRVTAYLARVGSVAIGGRDATTYQVACFLLRDLALPSDTALGYLLRWNDGNTPPLTERDVRAKLRSAERHGRRAFGAGLVERCVGPFSTGYAARPITSGETARSLVGGS